MGNLKRFTDVVPPGAGLHSLAELVGDDGIGFDDLEDLVGHPESSDFVQGPEIPRIRPILVALAARASGADHIDRDLQRTVELLHGALVVHDLALGREGGRRRRVARRIVKRSVSWLGGNHLTLRAMEIAQASRPEILGDLLHTLREFADGQALTQELQQGRIPTVEDWLEHADTHTGALFALCCRVGAVGKERATAEALARYGRHLGRVWHIAEDVSILAHPEGENVLLARALAGRPLLPVVEAAVRSPDVGRLWSRFVEHPSEATASWLSDIIQEAGGLAGARERMLSESWMARQALSRVPESRYRTAMEKLVSSIAVAGIRS
ncbi:MAG: polyprenyl synthetase family protein [Alphaproteobacteria bacterium]|nr:polyprenyl synthetase family protein [Alphaproteobacteria bacterium]